MPTLRRGGKGKGRTVKVESFKVGEYLGGRGEGFVWDAKVTVKKGEKTRTREMVLKQFSDELKIDNFRNPVGQLRTMHALRKLNTEKKLGLKINPTIRLTQNEERLVLIMTKLNIRKEKNLTIRQDEQFSKDRIRQVKACKENGYRVGYDSFFAVVKNGKATAVIGDFGNIEKIKKGKN